MKAPEESKAVSVPALLPRPPRVITESEARLLEMETLLPEGIILYREAGEIFMMNDQTAVLSKTVGDGAVKKRYFGRLAIADIQSMLAAAEKFAEEVKNVNVRTPYFYADKFLR